MKLTNPMRAEYLDMQDIKDGQYALMPPVSKLLRLEGLLGLVTACMLYHALGFSWWQFAAWFLLPDLAILVYVLGLNVAGMYCYNLTHSTVGAALLGVLGIALSHPALQQMSLIWFAHIGFDRALGYGLKYRLGFSVTHLGIIKASQMREESP